MPMVRTTSPMRCFCPANTCSTWARTFERFALALAMRSGIGRRGGFFWWMWLVNMPLARKASFFFERQAVSAQTPAAVLSLLIGTGNRAPSWALAALASQVRISPCARSMPTWFL